MKVKELVALLLEAPQELEVVVAGYEDGYDSVTGISPNYFNFNLPNTPEYYGIHELKEKNKIRPGEQPNGLILRSTRNGRN